MVQGSALDAPAGDPPAEAAGHLTALARRASAGDQRAVSELLSSVRGLVHRYCRARLGSLAGADQAAEDAAQEVCLTVLSALPGYRHEGRPFEAFVYRVAARRVADALRAARRGAVLMHDVPETAASDPTPEEHAVGREDADLARALLARLPDVHRELLTLRIAGGMSADQVGRALGMSPGAVRVAQHRALQRLRGMAGEPGG